MKKWGWMAFGGLFSLLAAVLLYWITRSPRGEPVRLVPAPTQSPFQIYVVGAVAQPGVYSLPPGSRVQDAIQSAGGFLKEADQEAVNLAELLVDGYRIRVPTQKAPPTRSIPTRPVSIPSETQAAPSGSQTTPGAEPLININTATLEELDSLPGIGPAIASRIMDYRKLVGGFKTIQDIMNVEGIGPAIFAKIENLITVGP